MARSLLVVPASPWAGLASTCLGLVRATHQGHNRA